MSERELEDLLERIEDTPELVLGPAAEPADGPSELFAAWDDARRDANSAYDAWLARPGADAYVIYRAAADRADAAEDALAAAPR